MTQLISPDDLARSLTDNLRYDEGLATWAIETISDMAIATAGRDWTKETVPPSIRAIINLASRRLYTNPDRFTREASGDYSYGLDSSVTSADIFTPRELAQLMQHRPGRKTGGLRTVATRRDPLPLPDTRVPIEGSDRGFPWYSDGDL